MALTAVQPGSADVPQTCMATTWTEVLVERGMQGGVKKKQKCRGAWIAGPLHAMRWAGRYKAYVEGRQGDGTIVSDA